MLRWNAVLSASISLLLAGVAAAPARAGTLQVPQDYPTIQDAVAAAEAGDQVRVGPGQWCGAVITKPLDLFGEGGATIVGCPAPAPNLFGLLRIGFFLPDGSASGTTIRHFVFDGQGVSNANLDPLAFAVFARDASDVIVQQNTVLGTVQAITNTRGSGWTVSHNDILGLTVLTCDGFCGGGDAIVFQQRTPAGPRTHDNSATFNVITGTVPDTLTEFSMVGVLVFGQDGMVVKNNQISIKKNPASTATAPGQAILVSDVCCGAFTFLTSVNSVIVNNDGRGSDYAVVITKDAGGGNGNSAGTTLRGNFGLNDINSAASTVSNRSAKTLIEFP